MMKQEKFSITKRIKSFQYAFNGLKILWMEEHNARIHFLASMVVVIAGFAFKVSLIEWTLLAFAMGFVIVTEIVNSSIENLADFVEPQKNLHIKKAKDLAAAAVLISAVTAVVIGLIVFVPKVLGMI
ncbi:MAG: diacylglycerol kinase family protein [Crocinitomicaceae bacterium]|nr:diacylglycerol kinase family protein [Crocinitomicaceae bacterium]